jgi:hypothetical protein
VRIVIVPLLALSGLVAAAPALAQAYRCSNGGAIYFSDRPCAGAAAPKMGAYGDARAQSAVPVLRTPPRPGKPEDHIKYLNPACADIAEAIRTAPARGVRGDVVSGLRDEYREKCSLQDEEARRQHQQDVQAKYGQQRAEREALALQREQAQKQAAQCNGMRDVIALKRSREASLNETEIAALRSLESSYNGRCLGR